MSRPNFLNVCDTIVMPGDPLSLAVVLVDYKGQPISLRVTPDSIDIRLTLTSVRGGWWRSVEQIGTVPPDYETELEVEVVDQDNGSILINVAGGVLNMLDGYNYTVQTKLSVEPTTAYKTVAKGKIEVFNQ